jgi:hypothetical protein
MQALQLQISHPILSSMVDPVLSHLDLVFGLRAHIEVEVVTMGPFGWNYKPAEKHC